MELVPGPYQILLTTKDWYRKLEFPLDLALEPVGSYCEERHFYPWGQ